MNKQGLEQRYQKTVKASHIDNLTGLFNFGIFGLLLEQEIARARRYGRAFSVILFGIDGFSQYNRKHGRISGDLALKSVGNQIAQYIRQSDIAARTAGDEFVVLLPETDQQRAIEFAENIRDKISIAHESRLTLSAGVLVWQEDICTTEETVMQLVGEALARAKSLGKDLTHCYNHPSQPFSDSSKPHILIVDDEPKNLKLLEAMLLPLNHQISKATNGEAALQFIKSHQIDVVLLDVMMPGIDGYEVCRRIRNNAETRLTPIILVTALNDSQAKVKGLEAGANDFISKPPNKTELIARTRSLIDLRYATRKLTSVENVLFSLARSIEAKDPYTKGHAERVAMFAVMLGRRFALNDDEIEALQYAGYLHDIGKIGTPREILNKRGKLSDDEFKVIQSHPEVGYNIVMPLRMVLGKALDAIRHHHERLDGSGYPDRLQGADIPLNARIMAVADVYDALTTNRPYRPKIPKEKAIKILREEGEANRLDPEIVEGLLQELERSDIE